MSREKQIEEMARDIPQRIVAYDRDPDGQYLYTEQRLEIAQTLYNAGYRKQKEDTVEVVRCKDCKFNVANMEKAPLDITVY